MQSIILHSYRRCPFAIRVRMTLEEKNLSYLVIEEDLSNLSPELIKLHPEGKVPLLLHEGQVIYESAIITEYLEDRFPTPALMPDSPKQRAQVRLWTYWCNELFKPDLDLYKYELKDISDEQRSELIQRLHQHLDELEQALTAREFLLGPELTLADLHVFPFYRQFQRAKPEFPGISKCLKTNAWLDRITSRPSFERTMVKKVTG